MSKKNSRFNQPLAALFAPLALWMNGCQSPQPHETAPTPAATPAETKAAPGAEPRPVQTEKETPAAPPAAAPQPTPTPEPAGETMHPATQEPAPRPAEATTKPSSKPDGIVLPPYIVRTIAIDATRPFRLQAETRDPSTLRLETNNLRRVRISRIGLPLARNRSVAIVIDNQGIEWTTRSDVIELERSAAGVWSVWKRE